MNTKAQAILDDPRMKGLNARQVMLRQKGPHGGGADLTFPDASEIDAAHRHARQGEGNLGTASDDTNSTDQYCDKDSSISKRSYHKQYYEHHDAYGDGSHTTPTKWWCALGGSGVWFPKTLDNQPDGTSLYGGAVGQTGSSTRQELAGFIMALTEPIRVNYATDSAAMLSKATTIINAVAANEARLKDGIDIGSRNPFGRNWGLQRDGELWKFFWDAVTKRRANKTGCPQSQRSRHP